jgi:hypothetical protein
MNNDNIRELVKNKLKEIITKAYYPYSRKAIDISIRNIQPNGVLSLNLGKCRMVEAMSIHNYLEKELKRDIKEITSLDTCFCEV